MECRRVNRKLERLRSEGKRDYRLNAFAQYLSGVLYEKEKNWNSAYVDYRKAQEIDSTIPFLRKDLLRGALIVDSDSDLTKWKRTYKLNEDDIISAKKSLKEKGALVFILQNGVAPEKVVSSIWPELPEYRKRYNKYKAANIYVNGEKLASTKILYDIEEAAKKNLEQKFATYILKRAAGFAAREIIGNKVAETTNSEGLGALTKIFMFMLSRPDLRSWLTLPQNLQMARIELAPGKHKVSFRLLTSDNIEEVEKIMGEIEIKKPGDIVLLNHRSFN